MHFWGSWGQGWARWIPTGICMQLSECDMCCFFIYHPQGLDISMYQISTCGPVSEQNVNWIISGFQMPEMSVCFCLFCFVKEDWISGTSKVVLKLQKHSITDKNLTKEMRHLRLCVTAEECIICSSISKVRGGGDRDRDRDRDRDGVT